MHVRSVEESDRKRVQNSIRAYLNGEKNLAWVTGIIRSSGLHPAACRPFLSYGADSSRKSDLANWIADQSGLSGIA
jgi:hypothetical protein